MFRCLIDETTQVQYTIELAIAGAVNGPASGLSIVDRLKRLRKHQEAWDTMTWTQDSFIKMTRGQVWELYGGVLAQGRPKSSFMFWQLPSTSRGTETKHWSVHLDDSEIKVRDFTIDPSQDLLVIVDCPSALCVPLCPVILLVTEITDAGLPLPAVNAPSAFISVRSRLGNRIP
jgi:hypothetical protein